MLWAPASSPLDVEHDGLQALTQASVAHVAIANPEHAPYGRAAVAAMQSAGVYDRVRPKLVIGENIAQTMQFVQSGAADVGIVALSLALAPNVERQGADVRDSRQHLSAPRAGRGDSRRARRTSTRRARSADSC